MPAQPRGRQVDPRESPYGRASLRIYHASFHRPVQVWYDPMTFDDFDGTQMGTDASYPRPSQVARGSQPEGGVDGLQVSQKMDGPKNVRSAVPQRTAQGAGQKDGPRKLSAAPLKSQKMFQPQGDSTSSGFTRFTPPKCRRCDVDMLKLSERRAGYCPRCNYPVRLGAYGCKTHLMEVLCIWCSKDPTAGEKPTVVLPFSDGPQGLQDVQSKAAAVPGAGQKHDPWECSSSSPEPARPFWGGPWPDRAGSKQAKKLKKECLGS